MESSTATLLHRDRTARAVLMRVAWEMGLKGLVDLRDPKDSEDHRDLKDLEDPKDRLDLTKWDNHQWVDLKAQWADLKIKWVDHHHQWEAQILSLKMENKTKSQQEISKTLKPPRDQVTNDDKT